MERPIHPFPARMAPELALRHLSNARRGGVVLDPMAGSGTVLRQSMALGLRAVGYDLDPLAVLMSRVATTYVKPSDLDAVFRELMSLVDSPTYEPRLPWVDDDEPTRDFVDYWFGSTQQVALRRLAGAFVELEGKVDGSALDVARVALSRLIITKDQGASLARDVSHSRPHRVTLVTDYDVVRHFARSYQTVRQRLPARRGKAVTVVHGDARKMEGVADRSISLILTSPPYLNAIDYMRGHRLSLVWLGYRLAELRTVRSSSVGSEAGLAIEPGSLADAVVRRMVPEGALPRAREAMVNRFARDMVSVMGEMARVIHPRGQIVAVVGNSCLGGVFIRNADGVAEAGRLSGLRLNEIAERDLPARHRYLPMPTSTDGPLGRRMRTETILVMSPA